MCDELRAEHRFSVIAHFFDRTSKLDTPCLASSAGMNLCLDGPEVSAQRIHGCYCFLRCRRGDTLWNPYAVLDKQCF